MPAGFHLKTSVRSKLKAEKADGRKRKNVREFQISEDDRFDSDGVPYRGTRNREIDNKRKKLIREGNAKFSNFRGSSDFQPRGRAKKDAATWNKEQSSEARISRRKSYSAKWKGVYDGDSDVHEASNPRPIMRKGRTLSNGYLLGKEDYIGARTNDYCAKVKSKQDSFENSSDKFGPKMTKQSRNASSEGGDVGTVDGISEDDTKKKSNSSQLTETKHERFQTRVLDKSGKKIRVNRKALGNAPAGTNLPVRKKKRGIRIDPYDTSNKRLDDGVTNSEKVNKEKTEISKNAQFRAIQPSSSILSFVEDNLLGRRRMIELKNVGYNVKLSAPLDNVPFSTSTERERIEENAFRNKLEFFASAKVSSSFPPPIIPEIAFAGRSNVGKSSLLNALTRQWGVVWTSDKPGLTQTINFFKLGSKLCLVDLPGYGFAYAKEEVKDAWEELVKEYVSTRVGLQQVCVLIDTKWGMKPRDHELIDLMERSQTPYQILLTKTDLVFPIDVARRAMQIQENLKSNKSIINPVMMVSSKSGAGIRSLRTVITKLARFLKP
ncbi:uncharacterized protein LOC141814850 [Curcuma longa]|uniref:uncharacterized protein LOC141814850 n=1 Tax=Curcuma longa TaxID=136217 RepID=UPI003D9EBFBC